MVRLSNSAALQKIFTLQRKIQGKLSRPPNAGDESARGYLSAFR
jgi:hypothetical protein